MCYNLLSQRMTRQLGEDRFHQSQFHVRLLLLHNNHQTGSIHRRVEERGLFDYGVNELLLAEKRERTQVVY